MVCTGTSQYVSYSIQGRSRNLKMVHTSTYQHRKFLWQYIPWLVCTGIIMMYCLVPAMKYLDWISYPISKHFDNWSLKASISKCTGVEYRTRYRSTSISKLCTRYRRHFRNFDIEANTSILNLKPTYFYIEVSLHYIEGTSKNFDIEDVTSISKVLLRCRSALG